MKKHNFFRNAFDKMVDARERQARRYVRGALLAMDDETLHSLGYSRPALRNIKPGSAIL